MTIVFVKLELRAWRCTDRYFVFYFTFLSDAILTATLIVINIST